MCLIIIIICCFNYHIWLVTGPGCSSLAYGAFLELGPFRPASDGKTLFNNPYAWNRGTLFKSYLFMRLLNSYLVEI